MSANEKLAGQFLPKRIATLPEYVHFIAEKYGERPALVARQDGGKRTTLTYRDLAEKSEALAEKLRGYFAPGDFVSLWAENSPGWAVTAFAVLIAGGILVPIINRLGPAEVDFILGHCKPKVLITSESLFAPLKKVNQALIPPGGVLTVDGWPSATGFTPVVPAREAAQVERPPLPADLALVMYTSGSLADPKGVMLPHSAILENVRAMLTIEGWDLEYLVSLLPMSHMLEFTGGLLAPLTKGGTVTYPKTLAADEILAAMREAKVTAMVCVPRFLRMFLRGVERKMASQPPLARALARFCTSVPMLRRAICRRIVAGFGGELRYLIVGGGPTDTSVLRRFARLGITVLQGYGLTETAPVVSVNHPGKCRIGTAGPPLPGIEAKVINANERGVGEVIVRGPILMSGYYNNPEATAKALRDGWLHTGDFGKMTADGDLIVYGRMGTTVVNEAGENIFPEEVEEVILRCRHAAGAAVFGYPPDRKRKLIAIVQADEAAIKELAEQHGGEKAALEEIRRGVEEQIDTLAAFKRPHTLHLIREPIPQTGTNKNRLKDILALYERIKGADGKASAAP